MNRSQRRAQKAFREQFRSQVEQERNGAPIPPEIAALMTKPKGEDVLFQVGVTVRATRKVFFLGPKMNEDACRQIASDVNTQIIQGQRRDWTFADAYPLTPIHQGV